MLVGLVKSLLIGVVGEVLAFVWFIGGIGLVRSVMMVLAVEGFSFNVLIAGRIVSSQLVRLTIIVVTKRFGLIIMIRLIRRLLLL